MKRFALLVLMALGLAMLPNLQAKEDEKKEFKATCPVSGGAAKEDKVVEVHGKKVYFCCENCPKAYEKDPKKFALKVAAQMLETAQITQYACPVSGEAINPEATSEFMGAKVGFCCMNCKGKFDECSADDKLACLFSEFDKGFTLQTTCPVSDGPIKTDKEAMVEYKGKKVFFCCENCPKAFEENPEKFLEKLPQFQVEEKEEK